MPKVETSPMFTQRGETSQPKISVSNKIGIKNHLDLVSSYENSTEIPIRRKRDLEEQQSPRRRVIKKLVRVEPVSNVSLVAINRQGKELQTGNTYATRKFRRKKIKIKKRKLIRVEDSTENLVKPRRKVVVTRKRLLTKPTEQFEHPSIDVQGITSVKDNLQTIAKESIENESLQSLDDNSEKDLLEIATESEIDIYNYDDDSESSTESSLEDEVDENEEEEGVDDNEEDENEEEGDEEYTTENNIPNNNLLESIELDEEESIESTRADENPNYITQNLPDYEPFFPELSESLDAPILLLKTTVLSSVDYETKTVVQSRLRTYTFVVTRVNGDEQIVTSTTEVKPQIKTIVVTEPITKFTTLTLLDFDATETLPFVPLTVFPSADSSTTPNTTDSIQEERGRALQEEARYNLATRIMSNGVEVIVAGDKTTLPGEPDVKRLLPSTIYKPVTLKPSTLSNHMMMIVPKDVSNIQQLSSSLYPNEFVTKTCLTTFTYLTTYLENGTTTVSSHEQVVSNIATEERNTGKILPTPSMGITLTQYPNLAVGVFLTTYTYLNTIMDGEQPLVVTSKHVVSNTVTAPDDYLSLLQPLEKASAVKDTNTYYSTVALEKTLYEGDKSQVVSTNEVVTQVVITESIPPKATSVMTSYIALDVEDPEPNKYSELITSDVVKTYFITYTYFNTILEGDQTVVHTNISTSSDVVTEKLYLHPKRNKNTSKNVINTSPISVRESTNNKKKKHETTSENFQIFATKTYLTTFTYFTTLLQQNKEETSTVISSRSRVVENVVTETIEPSLLDKKYIKSLRKEIKEGSNSIVKLATLNDGNKLEITAIARENIKPTKVLPIEKTKMPEISKSEVQIEISNPSVITGSTILFIEDDDPFAAAAQLTTPSLVSKSTKITKTQSKNELNSLLSSEIVKKPQQKNTKRNASKNTIKATPASGATSTSAKQSLIKPAQTNKVNSLKPTASKPGNKGNHTTSDPQKKKVANKITKQPAAPVSDLLGLGSININSLQALKPVLNAMAGLIQTNLKASRRNDSETIKPKKPLAPSEKPETSVPPAVDTQNRSPIYIPVGDIDTAESQNVASVQLPWSQEKNEFNGQIVIGKPTHESPLLNGGIPISPGEIITANSDVIIGKPGRIGPRIPAIPLNPDLAQDNTPIGMKPPPVPLNNHPSPPRSDSIHLPKKDDYVGPPPPARVPVRPPNTLRGDKHKYNNDRHIPLAPQAPKLNHIPVSFPVGYSNQIKLNFDQNIQQDIKHHQQSNQLNFNFNSHNSQAQNVFEGNYQDNVQSANTYIENNIPTNNRFRGQPDVINKEPPTLILGTPINDFNIQPSVLNEPIVLPEVIERSTGQPLLVNIQPSQVAFVNIPHNRTTALIYGGSTEPHRNGQYFDDPSPYPEPEFSGIESFSNGVPHFASVYNEHPNHSNQKEVVGVIRVGPQLINVKPESNPNRPEIRPSRPNGIHLEPNVDNRDVSLKVPPISFEMVHQGNDFNAHIINHANANLSPPSLQINFQNNQGDQNVFQQNQNVQQGHNNIIFDNANTHQTHNGQSLHQTPFGSHNKFGNLPQNQNNLVDFRNERPILEHNNQNHYQPQHSNILNKDGGIISQEQSIPHEEIHITFIDQKPQITKLDSFSHNRPDYNSNSGVAIDEKPPPPPIPQNTFNQQQRPQLNNNIQMPYNPAVAPVAPYQHKEVQNLRPSHKETQRVRPRPSGHPYRPKYPHVIKRPIRPIQPKPDNVPNFMAPPPRPTGHSPETIHHHVGQGQHIPGNTIHFENPPKQKPSPHIPHSQPESIYPINVIPTIFETNDEIIDHKEPDLVSEDGEVIQESNSRPLRPGQVPIEILKANLTTTTELQPEVTIHSQQNVNFEIQVANENEIYGGKKPSAISHPRPFVRPENQQTNEINHKETEIKFPVSIGNSVQFGQVDDYPSSAIPTYSTALSTTEKVLKNVFSYKTPTPYRGTRFTTTRNPPIENKYVVNPVTIRKPISSEVTTRRPMKPIENIYRLFTTRRPPTGHGYVKPFGQVVRVTKQPANTRPKVTSLPIDVSSSTHKPIEVFEKPKEETGSQTEEPFNENYTKAPDHKSEVQSTNSAQIYFDHRDSVSTPPTERVTIPPTPMTHQETSTFNFDLNIGEVPLSPSSPPDIFNFNNLTSAEKDMIIMKPPPVNEVKQPDINMQPPKIEINSPSGGIYRVPNIGEKLSSDLETQANTPKPYVPKPSEDMLPPPQVLKDEEVMGMSPPPPITTHRPILQFHHNVSTHMPIFSLEVDVPKTPLPDDRYPHQKPTTYSFENPTTPNPIYIKSTRRRRPFTRRPLVTQGIQISSELPPRRTTPKWQRPVTPINIINKFNGSIAVTENNTFTTEDITPTPSLKVPATMEVIIGHPPISSSNSSNKQTGTKVSFKLQNSISIEGSEVIQPIRNLTTPSTILENRIHPSKNGFDEQTNFQPTPTLETVTDFTKGEHHGGNQIKVIDDTAFEDKSNASSLSKVLQNKPPSILPTRYITHTKTSTVTITKTTVVKSLGSPPSTLTILVTKTEKSTIVDVITEFHTLIKPTSIVETITTTVKHEPTSLYPPTISYGSPYGPVQSTPVIDGENVVPTLALEIDDTDDSLEEFIIKDLDPPHSTEEDNTSGGYNDNDSILIVMTDKKGGSVVKVPPPSNFNHDLPISHETQNRDEIINSNEVNRVLLGGILIASPPSLDANEVTPMTPPGDRCAPECKASKNELCQKVEGLMRCVCRPGFARMFPDRPCKPTYTYILKLALERYGKEHLQFEDALSDGTTQEFNKLAAITHDGLDRMVMQSDLRDIYHGIQVKGYEPSSSGFGIVSEFYLQLSDNADENRLEDVFKKYLRNNNYSLGGTELYASRETLERLEALDFDECTNQLYHDCSENAQCFNLKGTYTCSCKEGYADLSENILYPGRICSAELVGCEKCHYHGTCYTRDDNQILCECFQWYAGENCHINLKVLLIALATLGMILFTLLLVCIVMTCCRKKPQTPGVAAGMSFLPQRIGGNHSRRSTLDRRAMIQDTSSESGQSDNTTLPYVAKKTKKPKGALKKTTTINPDLETGTNTLSFPDQKDRSLTVMIPRAKYHPAPPTSPHLNLTSFEKRKISAASSNETKLLSYLDAGPSPNKVDKRKYSITNSEVYLNEKQGSRKTSGALVSAGFEVSATVVGNNMGTLGTIITTCGTEADRSENATLIQKISADLLSSTGTQSQFNTFKKSIADGDVEDPMSNWLDIPPRVTTISESRSYDETTIQPPTKSYRNDYDSKPSSQHPNDEANTMAERDLGSTFLLPHTHLYKPDRGSDISGFESL